MVTRLNEQQLSNLKALGFSGEGYLDDLIEWLGDDFVSLHKRSMLPDADAPYQTQGNNCGGYGSIPLEAVYNLACAVRGKEKHGQE